MSFEIHTAAQGCDLALCQHLGDSCSSPHLLGLERAFVLSMKEGNSCPYQQCIGQNGLSQFLPTSRKHKRNYYRQRFHTTITIPLKPPESIVGLRKNQISESWLSTVYCKLRCCRTERSCTSRMRPAKCSKIPRISGNDAKCHCSCCGPCSHFRDFSRLNTRNDHIPLNERQESDNPLINQPILNDWL